MNTVKLAKQIVEYFETNLDADSDLSCNHIMHILDAALVASSPSPSETRTEYGIVEHPNAEALSVHVNRLIGLGWKPLGGVCVTPLGEGRWYSQSIEKQVISGQK